MGFEPSAPQGSETDMSIKVSSDLSGVYKKVEEKKKRAKQVMGQQIIKDSNYFAPMDTGTLIGSALTASRIEEGQIIWDTPYARKLYWNPGLNFSKDKNPNAQAMWFEAAKSNFISDWIKLATEEANR